MQTLMIHMQINENKYKKREQLHRKKAKKIRYYWLNYSYKMAFHTSLRYRNTIKRNKVKINEQYYNSLKPAGVVVNVLVSVAKAVAILACHTVSSKSA